MAQSHSSSIRRRVAGWAMAAVAVCAPGSVFAQNAALETESPLRDPRPFAALSSTAVSMRDSIVVLARSQIGTRYKFGGTTPKTGFDCSGFVRYVLAAIQLILPRTAAQQAELGATVPR